MSLRDHLRPVSRRESNLLQHLTHLSEGEIVAIDPTRRYLQLELTDNTRQCAQGWIDVDVWVSAMAAELPGIAWEQVPLRYLARWLLGRQLRCQVAGRLWTVRHMDVPEAPLPQALICLPTPSGPLLCQSWPEGATTASMYTRAWQDEVPFELRYVLGSSRLALSMLLDMADGDLLRIESYDPVLMVGHLPCFHFCLTEDLEVFVEERYVDVEDEELRGEEEMTFEWVNLPVNIEFVLGSLNLSIGELDSLQPGTQLPLAMEAEKKIKIYLNRKLFARGELIALDDGSLAVEVNQLNTLTHGHAGHPYAE